LIRKLGGLLALLLALPAVAAAQITIPNTLAAGAVIRAADLNTNFSALGDKSLNRVTGGVIEGNVTLNANVTFDGVDLSDFLLTTGEVLAQTGGVVGAPAFSRTGDTSTGLYFPAASEVAVALGGSQKLLLNASGVTAYGVNIINSSGKIPALSSTYLADLSGANLTTLNASNVSSGTLGDARLSANVPLLNAATNTFTGNAAFGGTLGVTGATTVGAFTASGAVALPASIRVGTSTTPGYVLTADGDGNATWQATGAAVGAVPAGMIAMFDTSCPATWTRVSAWDNKFVRGGATYSAAGGGSDSHTHTVDPASTASSADGAHSHTVDPLAVTSAAGGSHSHTTNTVADHGHDVIGSTASGGDHTHTGTTDNGGDHVHGASVVAGADGTDSAVGGGDSAGTHNHTFTTASGGSHTHAVDIDTSVAGSHSHTVSTAADHTHSVDVASTTSSTSATHTHTVDIASTSTSSGANVPAYVQVVFCKKD
jgi:hypothetical protein